MLIDVIINVRDLDPTTGPIPPHARVTFARLTPTSDGSTLISSAPVAVPLTDGHGTVKLQTATGYMVRCYGLTGFRSAFAVLTGSTATTLAALWQTGQIDPDAFTAIPAPRSILQLLTSDYVHYDGTQLTQAGNPIPVGGGGGSAGFQYLQSTPAASWSIPHAFGRRPNVELYTLAGERIFTDLNATTSAVYVTFPNPTAGYAVLT